MSKYTGKRREAINLNRDRLSIGNEIINGLAEKYGSVDNSMMAAVIASMNGKSDISIRGCQGVEKEKSPIASVRILGKEGNKLSVIATDENGEHKSGKVEKSKVLEFIGIERQCNEKSEVPNDRVCQEEDR